MNITFHFLDFRSGESDDPIVASNTTIQSFLVGRCIDPDSVTIRLNRAAAAGFNAILKDGDLLSITQKGLKGAVTAKVDGNVYQKHKNDIDTIISDCHCHDIDNGDVIDLRTGKVYRKQSKSHYKKLSPKTLRVLRSKLPGDCDNDNSAADADSIDT